MPPFSQSHGWFFFVDLFPVEKNPGKLGEVHRNNLKGLKGQPLKNHACCSIRKKQIEVQKKMYVYIYIYIDYMSAL